MNASRGILWFMYAWMGMCFGYGIYTAVVCGLKDDKRCPDYPDVLLAMQIVAMVMYLVFIACSVMTCKIYRHFDRCRQKICPISAGNVHVQTTHNQYGTNNAQSQFAMQPPTYDQSMNTSKY